MKPKAILFDLDGTLLDTHEDFALSINTLRQERGLASLPKSKIRPLVNHGSKIMLQSTLAVNEEDAEYANLRLRFLDLYLENIAHHTQFFPQIEQVLRTLDERKIPWGIVTNKYTQYTNALLKALNFAHRPGCIVCGDTLSTYKPHPGPVLHACELLDSAPTHCVFVGDSLSDIQAGKAAGATALAALYGFIGEEIDPKTWPADGFIEKPLQILDWL
jgi:phosphoglycolate phosphatase